MVLWSAGSLYKIWDGDFLDAVFRTQSCLLYQFVAWLIRAGMPLRHRRSALRLFGSYRLRGTAGAPWRRRLVGLCISERMIVCVCGRL